MSVSVDFENDYLLQPERKRWVDVLSDPVRAQTTFAVGLTLFMPLLWLGGFSPVVAAALLAVPFAIALVLRRPELICLGFVAFSFFRIHEAYPFLLPLRIPQALAGMSMIAIIWHAAIARTARVYWSAELRALVVVFAIVTFGCFMAVDQEAAFKSWGDYWKVAAMALALAWLVQTKEQFDWAARLIIIAAATVALVACYNRFAGIDMVEGSRVAIGLAIKSQLGDPNDLALIMLFPLAFASALLLHRTDWPTTLLALGAICLFLMAIIFTQSRGGVLGTVAVLGVIAYRYMKSITPVIVVGLLVGVSIYAYSGILDRKSGGGAVWEELDESAASRLYYWEVATRMALFNPMTGVGLDNFPVNYPCYSSVWEARGGLQTTTAVDFLTGVPYCTFEVPGPNKATHSVWFQVLGDHGIPGFIAYMVMVILAGLTALRATLYLEKVDAPPVMRASALAMLAALAGFCASGTFLSQAHRWPIYMILGLTAGVGQYVAVHMREAAIRAGSLAEPKSVLERRRQLMNRIERGLAASATDPRGRRTSGLFTGQSQQASEIRDRRDTAFASSRLVRETPRARLARLTASKRSKTEAPA